MNSRLTWLLGCWCPGVDQGCLEGLEMKHVCTARRGDETKGEIFKNSKENMLTLLEHRELAPSEL